MGDRKWIFSYIARIRVMLNESMLKMGDKSIAFSYIAWIYVKVNEFAPKMGDKPAILSQITWTKMSGSSVFREEAQFSERGRSFQKEGAVFRKRAAFPGNSLTGSRR